MKKLILFVTLISCVSFGSSIKECTEKLCKKFCILIEDHRDKAYCELGIFAICKDENGNYDKALYRINHFDK
jgi:hypothetical protein